MSLEAAGSWATLTVHDRGLLPLLHDLAVGRTVKESAGALRAYDEEAIRAVLALTSWCGLLDPGQEILVHKNNSDGKGNSYGTLEI